MKHLQVSMRFQPLSAKNKFSLHVMAFKKQSIQNIETVTDCKIILPAMHFEAKYCSMENLLYKNIFPAFLMPLFPLSSPNKINQC